MADLTNLIKSRGALKGQIICVLDNIKLEAVKETPAKSILTHGLESIEKTNSM